MASSIILVLEIAHCPSTLLVWCSDPEFIAVHCISGFVSARHSKKPQLAVKWADGGHPTQSYNSLCQFRSQRRVILKISLCCHTDRYCWRILCCISTVFFTIVYSLRNTANYLVWLRISAPSLFDCESFGESLKSCHLSETLGISFLTRKLLWKK